MNTDIKTQKLPDKFYLLHDNSAAENRPNRLCICLSDLHFTDGTVGTQSAEVVVWKEVFDKVVDMCSSKEIKELTLILDGDVVDMIRTALWSKNNVYPWQREHPCFKRILREIMQGIIEQHATPSTDENKCCFFHLLKHLPERLNDCTLQTLAIVGNHDKELFADDETLKMFYEQCLNQPIENLSKEYRRWIGNMYFNNPDYYADLKSVPRLPFYWGDQGFRLLVTHGQWRDIDNSRLIKPQQDKPGWQVKDGWQLAIWQKLDFAPFTQACFGDTVAAGVLSGFIYRTKQRLDLLEKTLISQETPEDKEINRLKKIVDELDLYRPTYAALQRIIKEIWRLRKKDKSMNKIEEIIQEELLNSIYTWLGWDFTIESAPPTRRFILHAARLLSGVLKFFGGQIELGFLYAVMWLLNRLKQGVFFRSDSPSYKEMQDFPTFLEEYRNCGFRIHGEGHTHIPLQDELSFNDSNNDNYTYINFGTWRDQILLKQKKGYRRRGFGRALSVIDLTPNDSSPERGFAYWVEDIVHWDISLDRL